MVKKVKKPIIKPFEDGEVVTLLCGAKFTVDCASSEGVNLDITKLVSLYGGGDEQIALLPIRDEALESLKLLIKRAEKTFQKR